MAIPVTLGALPLTGTDDAGVEWIVTDLTGWDSPGVRADLSPRQADHGAWPSQVYLGARPITIEGVFVAPDEASLDAAIDQLLVADSLTDTTLLVEDSIPRQVTVRRSGPPLVKRAGPYEASYSLLVTAADPRRYAAVEQSQSAGLPSTTGGLTFPLTFPIVFTTTSTGGTFSLVNAGSIGTRPVFTITGPVVEPVIVAERPDGSTMQLAYSDTLGVGDTLVIDCGAHSVVLNGTTGRRRFLSAQPSWPEIDPGSSLAIQWTASSYDPAALLTGTARSAWM
ncbi:phage tail domain-containing protein [Streptomyces sp. A1136]|uniref:phage distal tail protein n=1 Tax=Streptomyces sp. A1136 TaxID=2563102 RepID=UPI00109E707C|nr:phage tail domain-containing protein [Streptomyces sp. A1136]THA56096.1 hypothetical protein E6R62_12165 [Streptomyces sp. A1136]